MISVITADYRLKHRKVKKDACLIVCGGEFPEDMNLFGLVLNLDSVQIGHLHVRVLRFSWSLLRVFLAHKSQNLDRSLAIYHLLKDFVYCSTNYLT